MRTLDLSRPFAKAYGLSRGRIYLPAAIKSVAQWREPGVGYSFADTAGTTPAVFGAEVARDNDRRGARWGHDVQATLAARPLFGRRPRGGVRNRATGAAAFGNSTYWVSPFVNRGVTATIIDQGVEDGEDYCVIRFTGEATLGNNSVGYEATPTRLNCISGDQFHGSARLQVVAGDTTPVLAMRVQLVQRSTIVAADGATIKTTTEGLSQTTLAATDTGTVEMGLNVVWATGVPIDVTYRFRGIQFDRGTSRTAYQSNFGPLDITETGQPDVCRFRGSLGGKVLASHAALDLSGSDKASVVICLEKLSDVDGFSAFSHGGPANGGLEIEKAASVAQWSAATWTGGSIRRTSRLGAPAPDLAVLGAVLDRAGGMLRLRYNGEDLTPLDIGATSPLANVATAVMARADGSRPFAGDYYGRVYGAGEFTTAEFQMLESYFMTAKGVSA